MSVHIRRAAIGTIVLLLATAGCGGNGDDDGDAPADIPAIDINPVDREELEDGGTMRWPISPFPTQWNFLHLNGTLGSTSQVLEALLPTLWRFDENGNAEPNPSYLSGAELTSTDPDQVITYRLNPDARWSDGTDITWEDFASQWNALKGSDQRFQISASQGYNQIASVERGEDDYEAVVTYESPYGDWQAVFGVLYPASATSNPEAFNSDWVNDIPVTAGPFELDEIDQSAKTVTIVRDEDWWGDPPKLDRIVFRALESDAEINAFAAGEVDFLTVGTNASSYRRAQNTPESSVRKAAAPDFTVITFNGAADQLRDVRVRRALALAIDREAIANSALQAVDWPAVTMDNHFFVNTQEGYQDNAGEIGVHDPDRAGELLDEAGWTLDDDGLRVKEGDPLALRFVVPAGSPRSRQVGEIVQNQLSRIGVRVRIPSVPADDFFEEYVQVGNFELAPSAWLGTPFPVSSSRSLYAEPTEDGNGELQIQENFSRIGSEEIDDAMGEALTELDHDVAIEKANEADALIWEQMSSLVLYQQPAIVATKANLANFGSFGFHSVVYEDIGFTE